MRKNEKMLTLPVCRSGVARAAALPIYCNSPGVNRILMMRSPVVYALRLIGRINILAACFLPGAMMAAVTVTSSADDGGVNTLRSVIAAAPPGATVNFNLPAGSDTITLTLGQIGINKNLTISGPGATNLTIVGASPHARVFEILPVNNMQGSVVTISGLRFTGGYQDLAGQDGTQQSPDGQGRPPSLGGIILNDKSCALTVFDCIMEQCYVIGADGGRGFGGLVAMPGKGGPGAHARGGAIATVGTLTIAGCTFLNDSAVGGQGGAGSNAITSFSGSNGGDGGNAFGGAIYVEYNGDPPALAATNCTFFENLARGGDGGAGGTGLSAPRGGDGGQGGVAYGGAIHHGTVGCLQGECGNMDHCTVVQNYLRGGIGGAGGVGSVNGTKGQDGSGSGGGLFLIPVHFELENTIVAGDSCLGSGACSAPDVRGAVDSLGFNVIGIVDGFSSGWIPVTPGMDLTGTTANPLDPRLGPLQNNGGDTPTMAPTIGSPTIDAGGATSTSHDQAGQPRPVVVTGVVNGGDGSDVGAYELQCSLDVPVLSIYRSGNSIIIAWPWPSRCFVLQQSSDLINWMDSIYPINVVGNQNQVVLSPSLDALFFRLKK
jgi:hypothetical protein